MATYYVRSDAADDTGDGLSGSLTTDGSGHRAWKTIGKALGAAGIASGDTVYVAPGVYREQVDVQMTNPTATTLVIGNVEGDKFGLPGGYVIISSHTSGDLAAAASTRATLALNGRDFLTFRNFIILGSANATTVCVEAGTDARNITFERCVFYSAGIQAGGNTVYTVRFQATAGQALNGVIDRCIFWTTNTIGFSVNVPQQATSDYNVNFLIKHSFSFGTGTCFQITGSGTNTNKGGGLTIVNCSAKTDGTFARTLGSAISTTFPLKVYNCFIYLENNSGSFVFNALNAGEIVEDYNKTWTDGDTYSSTMASFQGANTVTSVASGAMLLEVGQSFLFGMQPRMFFTPWLLPDASGNAMFNFATHASWNAETYDLLNRPRPAGTRGTGKTVGALELHDTAVRETGTTQAGGVGIVINGPGDHDFLIPVTAATTTVSVYARYDTNHGTTNKPQAILMANEEIGVTLSATQAEADRGYHEVKTMTAAVDTWELLTFTSITPTAKGVVTLRLVSRAAAGTGKAFFDTVNVQ